MSIKSLFPAKGKKSRFLRKMAVIIYSVVITQSNSPTISCLHLINPALIEEYAIVKTRWLECEWTVAQMPVMSDLSPNPMVDSSIKYLKAANEVWDRIWAIVAQNSSTHYGDDPNRDAMARLLNSKPKAI